MQYIVDMQGFKQPGNDYILKELAIASLSSNNQQQQQDPAVYLFKPPFAWERLTAKYKRENEWLKQCYHGIPWNIGNVPYTEIANVLRENLKDASKILVMGSLKKNWLERFKYRGVEDVAEIEFPPLRRFKVATVCPNHIGMYKATCALHNVKLYRKFHDESSPPMLMEWQDV